MRVIKERFRRPHQVEIDRRVLPVFEDFHLLRMEGDYEYPCHQHTCYEVIFVERGPYTCELNGVEITLGPREVLVIKPGDWHQDHLRDAQRHYVLHFRLKTVLEGLIVPELFREAVAPESQISRGVGPAVDMSLFRELALEANGGAAYAAAVQDGLLEVLFWRIVRGLDPVALSTAFRRLPEREAKRERIASVFMRFLSKNPNVDELALALRMSPRQLVIECRSFFGKSPARLLLSFKLSHADDLLRHRGLLVREVSEQLGFANPYHFSRVYSRERGHAPSRQA